MYVKVAENNVVTGLSKTKKSGHKKAKNKYIPLYPKEGGTLKPIFGMQWGYNPETKMVHLKPKEDADGQVTAE